LVSGLVFGIDFPVLNDDVGLGIRGIGGTGGGFLCAQDFEALMLGDEVGVVLLENFVEA
jgi:hypothetical protein